MTRDSSRTGSPADATGSRAAGIPNSGYTSTTTCAPPSRWSRARWPASPRWWPGPETAAPRERPGDPQIAFLYWLPGVATISVPEPEPGGYWVRLSQLLEGPVWPVIDWLLWWAFVRAGEHQLAERIRESSLEQIAEGGFAEYFEPFTGEPLGSREQSWTAAVALDWLAHGPRHEMRAA